MAIGNRGIGWSQEENLLWEVSRQLDRMNSILCTGPCPTTTTTTTLDLLVFTNYTFVDCAGLCVDSCTQPFDYYNVWMLQSCIESWPSIGCDVWLDEEKTTPFPDGSYNNGFGNECIVITGGTVTDILT
jgi:hypothetical protein